MKISKHATILASLAVMVSTVIVGGFNSVSGASGATKTISVMYWTNFDTPGTNATPKLIKAAATRARQAISWRQSRAGSDHDRLGVHVLRQD